jgi:23S rRNA pseudouridine1911/1915/1917 synthase
MKKITITENDQGRRLDLLLKFELPEYSRESVRKLLDAGHVQVNGLIEYRPNYKVKVGDVVEPQQDLKLSRRALIPYKFKLDVIYEDEDLLIVNKPAGLKVHPSRPEEHKTLINAVYHYYEQKGEVENAYGYTLINRIDQATSGLVLIAKSPKSAWHYAQQFARSLVKKYYIAVVYATWNLSEMGEWFEIRDNLTYNQRERKQAVALGKGDFAHTKVKFLAFDKKANASLLLLQPITGRTHQLRIQLAERGYPIIGDSKYAGEPCERLLLHAYHLRIQNINEQDEVVATAPVPAIFMEVIANAEKLIKI